MVTLKTNVIKDLTTKISKGIENDKTVRISELLELSVSNGNLTLIVANNQFYLTMQLNDIANIDETFHATIDASTFIKLVSKTTTDEIKLYMQDDNLLFEGNGKYVFPLELSADGNIMVLPKIDIIEPHTKFTINGDILCSIYDLGKGELANSNIVVDETQKYYYVDNNGSITFSENPYINNFKIDTEFKLSLPGRIAELLGLFKGYVVNIELSTEENSMYEINKISITSDNIKLVAYLPSIEITDRFPAPQCRALQEAEYLGKVKVDRNVISNAIERLNIFSLGKDTGDILYRKAGKFTFTDKGLEIMSVLDKNIEFIPYTEIVNFTEYSCYMNLEQLQRHLKSSSMEDLTISYGNDTCLMFTNGNFVQIVVELSM